MSPHFGVQTSQRDPLTPTPQTRPKFLWPLIDFKAPEQKAFGRRLRFANSVAHFLVTLRQREEKQSGALLSFMQNQQANLAGLILGGASLAVTRALRSGSLSLPDSFFSLPPFSSCFFSLLFFQL